LKSNPKGLKSNPNPWIYYSIGAVKKFTAPKLNPVNQTSVLKCQNRYLP
jgi:hypothetical protein